MLFWIALFDRALEQFSRKTRARECTEYLDEASSMKNSGLTRLPERLAQDQKIPTSSHVLVMLIAHCEYELLNS